MGRMLMLVAVVLFALGAVLHWGGRWPLAPGRLPGDIVIRGKNTVFYFPLTTCLLLSVLLGLASWWLRRR